MGRPSSFTNGAWHIARGSRAARRQRVLAWVRLARSLPDGAAAVEAPAIPRPTQLELPAAGVHLEHAEAPPLRPVHRPAARERAGEACPARRGRGAHDELVVAGRGPEVLRIVRMPREPRGESAPPSPPRAAARDARRPGSGPSPRGASRPRRRRRSSARRGSSGAPRRSRRTSDGRTRARPPSGIRRSRPRGAPCRSRRSAPAPGRRRNGARASSSGGPRAAPRGTPSPAARRRGPPAARGTVRPP